MSLDKNLRCVNGCGFLHPNQYEGVEVDVCPQCKGIWLSFDNLNQIISKKSRAWTAAQKAEILPQTGKAGVPKEELDRHLDCPECGELMLAFNYQYSSGIIINKCKHHHGIWLDCGELNKIQIYKETVKNFNV